MSKAKKSEVERLTTELFTLVEMDQGEAHVSDAAYATSVDEFWQFTEAQLFFSRRASRKIAGFIAKNKR